MDWINEMVDLRPIWALQICATGHWEEIRHSRRELVRHWLILRLCGSDDQWEERQYVCDTRKPGYAPDWERGVFPEKVTIGDYVRDERP